MDREIQLTPEQLREHDLIAGVVEQVDEARAIAADEGSHHPHSEALENSQRALEAVGVEDEGRFATGLSPARSTVRASSSRSATAPSPICPLRNVHGAETRGDLAVQEHTELEGALVEGPCFVEVAHKDCRTSLLNTRAGLTRFSISGIDMSSIDC